MKLNRVTLTVLLPTGGSRCGAVWFIVNQRGGVANETISDMMGRGSELILRRPVLLSAEL